MTEEQYSSIGTMVKVLCCLCGVPIAPNPSNTCATCLASQSDVTRGISTEATLHQCRGCQRWHKDANKWIACDLESRELMALCLSNVSGLGKKSANKVRLVDAGWIWTEPHSMRLKVRLTIQKEVQEGTILQQSFTVIFVVRNQQCTECQAEFRQGSWKSLVQVRQRVGHKRTFLYLEQLILKHGAHRGCLSIETFRDGMDFYFPDRGKASRFICFLESVVPVRVKMSRKLIGIDDKSNTANYKFTNFVEICPLCKDDLLYLPAKLARTLGNIPRIVLVKNVSSLIHLIDPLSGQTAAMSADQYWRDPLRPIITAARSRLTRYVVLGKEPLVLKRNVSRKVATRKNRSKLAIVTMAKEEDLGVNDVQFEEPSYVGYLMKSGDVCLGYDLTETQFVDDDAEALRDAAKLPSAIVVRKLYGGVATNDANAAKMRVWKLQRLDVQVAESLRAKTAKKDAELDDMDEEDFLREVEADAEMRKSMNLYKSEALLKTKIEDEAIGKSADLVATDEDADDEDEDDQQIKLEELLDGLVLDDGPDGPDEFIPENTATMGEDEAWEAATQFYTEGAKAAKDGLSYVPRDHANQIRDKETAVSIPSFSKQFMAENDKKLPK
jgi:nonsense-mediated mRNA decay protein 3